VLNESVFEWPPGRTAAAIVTIDVDAESSMLYDHPQTARQLNVMAHQAYDARVGVPRLLQILARRGIHGTFFVPGYTADRWPRIVNDIRDQGHEIGHHGYLHEPLHDVDEATEEGYLLRGLEALDRVAGVRPVGYRAPKFRLNFRTPAILARHGFVYESSLMDSDWPYRLATAPEPEAPSLIELPVQWSLDDWSQFGFMPGLLPATTVETADKALNLWMAELEALVSVGGVFVLTLHPYLSGRPSRAAVVERLLDRMLEVEGLWIATGSEVAAHAQRLSLPPIWHRPIEEPDVSRVLRTPGAADSSSTPTK
jgi:peptidoglycan/xylan/chitin deacetylase (PgdA/CDA1 family)